MDTLRLTAWLLVNLVFYLIIIKIWMTIAGYIGDQIGIYKFVGWLYNKIRAVFGRQPHIEENFKMNLCKDINEVRSNIDRIDNQIVTLIAERSGYVKQAAAFKKNTEEVKAPQRVEMVIEKVRKLAEEKDVNPDIVEGIYRTMIASFINFELAEKSKLDNRS